jgi:cytoskeletal protein RodZ
MQPEQRAAARRVRFAVGVVIRLSVIAGAILLIVRADERSGEQNELSSSTTAAPDNTTVVPTVEPTAPVATVATPTTMVSATEGPTSTRTKETGSSPVAASSSSTGKNSDEGVAAPTAVQTSTDVSRTGTADTCSDGLMLEDADLDGWGECVQVAPAAPLDLETVVWWSRIGAFRQAICEDGYENSNAKSLVPGGLHRATFEFLCASIAAEQRRGSSTDP